MQESRAEKGPAMLARAILHALTGIPGVRAFWHRFPVGPLPLRAQYGISRRPAYLYGVYRAAELAHQLKLPGISACEFGVAGGNGLVALERIAADVERLTHVPIDVYGFDLGSGMPAPCDYRDLPHVWGSGFYRMDESSLRARLSRASLIVGDVAKTVPMFRPRYPLGFVAFDLDYYSSTKAALPIFDGPPQSKLPRVFCYFDDTIWPERACHSEYTGELCAIREFNAEHAKMKLCQPHLLTATLPRPAVWHHQIYVMHDFEHPLYCVNVTPEGETARQLVLKP
jgi:hypothetical protein